MIHSFNADLITFGNKSYIEIPFNVWDTCNQKGMIPVSVSIKGISFECKLIPKGEGIYYIPITKATLHKIGEVNKVSVQFQIINTLSRIVANSPYNKENPIRKIDSIEFIKTPSNACSFHTCVAMLTGVSVDEVMKVMKSNNKWQVSLSKVIEALDYYGISHADKFICTRGKAFQPPKCCIINARKDPKGLLMVYFNGNYYNPTSGILEHYDYKEIISYMEIHTG